METCTGFSFEISHSHLRVIWTIINLWNAALHEFLLLVHLVFVTKSSQFFLFFDIVKALNVVFPLRQQIMMLTIQSSKWMIKVTKKKSGLVNNSLSIRTLEKLKTKFPTVQRKCIIQSQPTQMCSGHWTGCYQIETIRTTTYWDWELSVPKEYGSRLKECIRSFLTRWNKNKDVVPLLGALENCLLDTTKIIRFVEACMNTNKFGQLLSSQICRRKSPSFHGIR